MPPSITCPMAAVNGAAMWTPEGGADELISTCRSWNVTYLTDIRPFVASNTQGATGRRHGVFDWNGAFSIYGSGLTPDGFLAMPGEKGMFTGYPGSGDVAHPIHGAGPIVEGQALLTQLQTTWDWMNNEILQTTFTMEGNGPIVAPTNASVIDNTYPSILTAGDCAPWQFVPVGGSAMSICMQKAVLTVITPRKPYADSCTGAWRQSLPGVFDWNLAITIDEADWKKIMGGSLNQIVPGNFVEIKAYVDGTEFWWLKYGIIQDFNNYNVNIETGDIISYTINILMNIDNGQYPTPTGGAFWVPGATIAWWPPAAGSLRDAEGFDRAGRKPKSKTKEKVA